MNDAMKCAIAECLRAMADKLDPIVALEQPLSQAFCDEIIRASDARSDPVRRSMADECTALLAEQKAELAAHDARSALLANIEPATLTKRTPVSPIKRRAALRDVGKGKT